MDGDVLPDDYQPRPGEGPIALVVDGEVFTLRMRPDGGTDYDWGSGPNDGYGFGGSPARTAGDPGAECYLPTMGEHRESIRSFLGMINPATGYID
ncbi:hypothetical protein [Nocardia cyriacigeorgica]|uniref:Uncharacterized protein n=1 Tax=Nocardia cyriacigeorgica TaxID=135487 RepID=A0A5R8NPC5_9NOCA|nr:hypothetical protein [Nocardia cyriacigeorgica]TLF77546.1 hypothetical protein FEK34_14580 [Nocardia cyriacigeorgica]